ncbi:hypothetical protein SDRG_11738 [Saprolegnia diclina VS20]|uniref:Uncharacterized protein n=1 Tax=Saprolegnia diclina (strain VS20) TaxID=1156394 RepID=T0QAX7_SAPDV|nr:hypothetical protein SDRG_11738 [Saprolegnia diclina VS20]EQC30685.1 hypothetical protein SDRG_11738 [Saprolegnia diclina VS20]|eukprot:XP_008616011.1 hypothetical protein SDRG_11738 [Saprolegnia diclina VS20]
MLGNFVAYASLLLLLSVQHVPSPTSRLVPFSTPILLYATTVSVVLCLNPEFATVSNAFYAGAWNLPLTINGVDRPAGAYDMASVPSAASLLLTHMLYPALVSILASIGLATAHRYVTCRSWSISTTWTATNAFLLATRKPSYLTSLPLGQEAAITIGNKCFCKPSTQAILGYATVTQGTSTKVFAATTTQTETRGGPSSSSVAALPKANAPVALVLSTYQLLPVLLGCLRPRPFGSVAANQFVSTSDSGNSDHATKRFVYSRGFCVN